jgi:hypothetical protein
MLTLVDGHICALCDCRQNTGILTCQSPLFSSECGVNCWVHVHMDRCDGGDVVGLACFRDSPGKGKRSLGQKVAGDSSLEASGNPRRFTSFTNYHRQSNRKESQNSNKDFLLTFLSSVNSPKRAQEKVHSDTENK